MAEKKNFIIENYNGTDYDTLYPETNSGQVLLDTVAQASTNLSSGSTLDDALNGITKDGGGFQVGDTLTTARKNLGDKWLLCNGSHVLTESYPELGELFDSNEFDWVAMGDSGKTILNFVTNADSTNEKFLISTDDGVYFGDNLVNSASWTKLFTYTNADVYYLNNTWIVISGTNWKYYSGNEVTADNFANIFVPSSTRYTFNDIAYSGGKYYILSKYTKNDNTKKDVLIYTDLAVIPATVDTNYSNSYRSWSALYPVPNGVATTGHIDSSTSQQNIPILLITSNGTTELFTSDAPYYGQIPKLSTFNHALCYFNNKYYIYKCTDISTSGTAATYHKSLYSSDTINGTYTVVQNTNSTSYMNHPFVVSDNFLISYYGCYIDKENVAHPWSSNLSTPTDIEVGADKYYATIGSIVYSCSKSQHFVLPSVSVADGLYTYIKAKSKSN